MVDERKITESVESFLENPYWKKYYEDAPSDACRRYIALEFYYSDSDDAVDAYEEVAEEMDDLEARLSLADWQHLLKYCGNNPRRAVIAERIKALSE